MYRQMLTEITPELVDAFLATKADSDIIGTPSEPDMCLVSNTLQWKYPQLSRFSVGPDYIHWWDENQCFREMPVGDDILTVITLFDNLPPRETTKAEFQMYLIHVQELIG